MLSTIDIVVTAAQRIALVVGNISWQNDVRTHGIEFHGCRERRGPTNDVTRGENNMQSKNPLRSTQCSFPISKCAIAVLCCAFSIEPLFAQELDWPNNGNDQGNMRYQNIDQITLSNVSQLQPAWTFQNGVLPSAHPRLTMEM